MNSTAPAPGTSAEEDRRLLQLVGHILRAKPHLAKQIEAMAATAQAQKSDPFARERLAFQGRSNEEIFSTIYARGVWGGGREGGKEFYSGSGSRTPAIVETYVEALRKFTVSLGSPPSAVDLGCGDFAVGARIRPLFSSYIACDVVGPLIEHNRTAFACLDVDFRHLDICRDPLPPADVAMVRQVLQHLSNRDILHFVEKVRRVCKYLICTEHVPNAANYQPNMDKPTGHNTRLAVGSGVDLARSPFALQPAAEEVLCAVPEMGGMIVTKLYRLHAVT